MYNTAPTNTAQMVFADSTSEALINNIINGKVPFPLSGKSAVLLYGTFGTGRGIAFGTEGVSICPCG